MLTWIKMAGRNLFRNGRRSIFTILAIGLGFAAVNLFGGFTQYILTSVEEGHIYTRGNGHLMISKRGFRTEGKLNPADYLLSELEVKTIRESLRGFLEVRLVTPQLHISGLLSNGEVSTIFVAIGRVPSDVRKIQSHARGLMATVNLFSGKPLDNDSPNNIGLSSGLAKQLNLKIGSGAIALAPTVNGQMNALDVDVVQLFYPAVESANDMLMVAPIKLVQLLYDTSSVDGLAVLLDDGEKVDAIRAALAAVFKDRKLDVEVATWRELNPLYTRTKEMFDVIFLFIFIIVLVIVVMSVVNTMSMAIVERTREIGTLRALGAKRGGILSLFALESTLLGGIGSVLGMGLTVGARLMINVVIKPTWIPPVIGERVPLEVYLVPEHIIYSSLFLILLSLAAALLSARRAANQEIVDALGHV
ncbi:MAG: ABC transporter permease [Deltaproteobacteria bacterium]|nr:ABC transporter permease [Deltaproteobacteria bacterium]